MEKQEFVNDIPMSAAIAAHHGTSMVPERRGAAVVQEFASIMAADFAALSKLATTEEKRALLVDEFARYRAGARSKELAYLSARSRCLSVMITGPSNFPGRRNSKRNDTADKRGSEAVDFRERALKAIARKLTPELQPVKSSDADAVQRLTAKIEAAEKRQALMKAANKIVKGKPKNDSTPEKVAALEALGLRAAGLFEKNCFGGVGFESYELTNNNANIRRMKMRVAKVARSQSTPDKVIEGDGVRLEDCPSDNRVRLFYPGKPSDEIRAALKSSGFRWSRRLVCWQAFRNSRSMDAACKFAGVAR